MEWGCETFDVRGEFDRLLELTLLGNYFVYDVSRVAMPISWPLVAPHLRTARECGLEGRPWSEVCPDWLVQRIYIQQEEIIAKADWETEEVHRSTLAELALVLAERRGFVFDGRIVHPTFKFIGTKTGRFGHEGSPNPMALSDDEALRVTARRGWRIGSIDFSSMDLCSMVSLSPELAELYRGADDLHLRTTELLGLDPDQRDEVKHQTWVQAYGGPDKDYPIRVQERSATTFRWALGACLRTMVGSGEVMPLFPVHDELVVEYRSEHYLYAVADDMVRAALESSGVAHRVRVRTGANYGECR